MGRAADVKSVGAVRAFKNDLLEYQTALRQTLEMLITEVRRGIQWLESDRKAYWPAQVRKASDAMAEARINLQRCMLVSSSDELPSCYDENKALQRAKRRLVYTEQKVRVSKHWLHVALHEAEEFRARIARLQTTVDHELPRGVAMLENLARALEKYVGYSPNFDDDVPLGQDNTAPQGPRADEGEDFVSSLENLERP